MECRALFDMISVAWHILTQTPDELESNWGNELISAKEQHICFFQPPSTAKNCALLSDPSTTKSRSSVCGISNGIEGNSAG